MISWRTDIENAPRDGRSLIMRSKIGEYDVIYADEWMENQDWHGVDVHWHNSEITHWAEINEPEE
jgi:hypothetical protein